MLNCLSEVLVSWTVFGENSQHQRNLTFFHSFLHFNTNTAIFKVFNILLGDFSFKVTFLMQRYESNEETCLGVNLTGALPE